MNYDVFQLFTIDGGDWLTFFATIISGLVSAFMVFFVFLLTRDFQKKQDEKSQKFQEVQAKEAKDFQKKQDEESQNFQEKLAKESREVQEKLSKESKEYQKIQAKDSRDFQEKLAEESRRLEEKINQKNLEHDYKTNQPYFKFEKLNNFIKGEATYNNPLIYFNWLYPDDKQRELLNDEEEASQLSEYLRFKNIGKGLAKDIEISLYYDYNTLLENASQMDITKHQLQHQFKKSKKDKNKYKFIYGDYNREINFYKKNCRTSSSYKYRIVNSNEYIEIPLDLDDKKLFNYYLCYLNASVDRPKLKINISYYDLYDHKFTDEIDLEFKVHSKKMTSSHKKEDEFLTLIVRLDEADKSKLKTKEVDNS